MPTIQRDPTTGRSCRNADGLTVKCGCGDGANCALARYKSVRLEFSGYVPADPGTFTKLCEIDGTPGIPTVTCSATGTTTIPAFTLPLDTSTMSPGAPLVGVSSGVAWARRSTIINCALSDLTSEFFESTGVQLGVYCTGFIRLLAGSQYFLDNWSDRRVLDHRCTFTAFDVAVDLADLPVLVITNTYTGTDDDSYTTCTLTFSEDEVSADDVPYDGDWNTGLDDALTACGDCNVLYDYYDNSAARACTFEEDGSNTRDPAEETTYVGDPETGLPKLKETYFIFGPCPCGPVQFDGVDVVASEDYPGDSDGPWDYNATRCRWEYIRHRDDGIIIGPPDPPDVPAYVVAGLSLVLGGGFSACLAYAGGCTWSYSDTGFSCTYTVSGTTGTLSGFFTVGFVCVYPFSVTFSLDCASGTCLPSDTVNQTVYTTDEGCQPDREGTFSVGDGSGCGGEP